MSSTLRDIHKNPSVVTIPPKHLARAHETGSCTHHKDELKLVVHLELQSESLVVEGISASSLLERGDKYHAEPQLVMNHGSYIGLFH